MKRHRMKAGLVSLVCSVLAVELVLYMSDGANATDILGRAHAQTRETNGPQRPLVITEQGSFFVGGTTITAPGVFDPTVAITSDAGLSFHVDQLYARFQIPRHPRRYPLVLIHGAGATGKTFESTPDGRDGYETIFLRRGFAVYVVDFPRRGRAALPSFNGSLGRLLDTQLIPDATIRTSDQAMFIRYRLGPEFLQFFPNTQFPKAGLEQYFQESIPWVGDDENAIADGLVALLDKIGPAILVPHSQSGRFACLAAIRSPNVRAIISYEGINHTFPVGEAPPPMPRYDGMLISPGAPVSLADFERLTQIPIQIVQGDNIPTSPTPNLLLDIQRIQAVFREEFIETINRHGGDGSMLKLPDVGIRGNTHYAFADLNNLELADL